MVPPSPSPARYQKLPRGKTKSNKTLWVCVFELLLPAHPTQPPHPRRKSKVPSGGKHI